MKKEKKPCPVCGEMFVNVGVHMRHKHTLETMELEEIKALKGLDEGPRLDRLGMLKAEGEATASGLGHDLNPWEDQRGGTWSKTQCSLCGMTMHAAPHPAVGNLPLDGEALRNQCP